MRRLTVIAVVFIALILMSVASFSAGTKEFDSLLHQNRSASFSNITTNTVVVPQGIAEQSIQLYEAAANGNNKITIKPGANLTSDHTIVFTDHGMYVDSVQVLSW